MSGVAHTRWAWLLAAYAAAGVAARLGLGVDPPHDTAASQLLVPLVVPVVGAACLLLVRLPGHGVTRVLTLVAVATVTGQWLAVVQHRVDGPVADRVLDALTGIAWTGEVPALALLVLLFPTGRPPGPRWRVVLRAQLAALGLLVVGAAVLDTTSPLIPFVAAPAGLVLLATTAAAAWSLVLRWRRGDPDERAGMRGFVLLAVVLVACYAISGTAVALGLRLPAPVADGVFSLLFAGLPAAVAYGVLRHRLYDIDVVVRRVAVWTVLSAALLGIYLGVAVGIDALLGGRRGIDLRTLVAAAVVALGLAPLRRLLQVGVDRLLYGRRGDPADVVRRAGRELAAAGAAADVPQRLAELLTTSLRLPWVAVELDREGRWERVAQAGTVEPAPEAVLVVPMSSAGEVPARLRWPPVAVSGCCRPATGRCSTTSQCSSPQRCCRCGWWTSWNAPVNGCCAPESRNGNTCATTCTTR